MEMKYKLSVKELNKIHMPQLYDFEKDFKVDKDGNVLIPYQHKGYTCNDEESISKIKIVKFMQ